MTRPSIALAVLLLTLFAIQACGDDEPAVDALQNAEPAGDALQNAVAAALDSLVGGIVEDRPSVAAAYTDRLRAYLEAHPAFYGAAAALLDEAGTVIASPYVHRTTNGYNALDLASPDYDIAEQDWITMPLEANAGVWTPPYFDAGGGDIWMITRSVPARDANGVFAIVTTDLPVDEPEG